MNNLRGFLFESLKGLNQPFKHSEVRKFKSPLPYKGRTKLSQTKLSSSTNSIYSEDLCNNHRKRQAVFLYGFHEWLCRSCIKELQKHFQVGGIF